MVVPAAVPAVGPLGAHHSLSRIVLVLGSVVGVAVGAADVVDGDVVWSSGNGGGYQPCQSGHRISNLSYKTPPWRRRCWQRRRGRRPEIRRRRRPDQRFFVILFFAPHHHHSHLFHCHHHLLVPLLPVLFLKIFVLNFPT